MSSNQDHRATSKGQAAAEIVDLWRLFMREMLTIKAENEAFFNSLPYYASKQGGTIPKEEGDLATSFIDQQAKKVRTIFDKYVLYEETPKRGNLYAVGPDYSDKQSIIRAEVGTRNAKLYISDKAMAVEAFFIYKFRIKDGKWYLVDDRRELDPDGKGTYSYPL